MPALLRRFHSAPTSANSLSDSDDKVPIPCLAKRTALSLCDSDDIGLTQLVLPNFVLSPCSLPACPPQASFPATSS
jgi:hypothetical protein